MRSLPFTDLLSNIVDNRGRTCPIAESGIPLIATNCVKNTGLFPTFEKLRYVDENTYKTWFRGHPKPGDLVFVTKGSPGQVCLVPDPVPFCIAQDMVAIRANPEVVYPKYLFAALRSPEVQEAISNMHVGSLIPHFKKGDFSKLSIPVPEMSIQRVVGDTFIELSSKIELNRKMNATLEAMARALFRDWFIDFGPTRAKMDGREPYLSSDLWALFPDRLDDQGKPADWRVSGLLDLAFLVSGGTPKTDVKEFWNGNIPWASAKDVSQCKDTFLIETERRISEIGLRKSATKIIPKYATVIVARGATTGRSCMFGSDIAMNQTCYALTSQSKQPFWLNCAVGEIVDQLVNAAHGSVFDTITTRTMERVLLVEGPSELRDRFEALVSPLFHRLLSNVYESRTLAQTRDLLLPRLMSGELRVADLAPSQMEPAA